MAAGNSAAYQAQAQTHVATELARLADVAAESARRYRAAAVSEQRLAEALLPLGALGYYVLPDRRWPNSRRAQVDFVVVGPGGVFIVDAKNWRDVHVESGRIFRGEADVTDDFSRLAHLAHTTEEAFTTLGLAPGEVRALAVFTGRRGLRASADGVDLLCEPDVIGEVTRRGQRLTPGQVDDLLAAALEHFRSYSSEAEPLLVSIPAPVLEIQPAPEQLLQPEEILAALERGLLQAPIEEWMTFLHPEQAKLVRRSFNGPSRIRGSAGTGKTVVALHRAAYLARNGPGTVLVTSYVRTLPAVLSALFARMAPELVGRVEFRGVHEFAGRVLRDRGDGYQLSGAKADAAFNAAWAEHRAHLSPIIDSKDYWKTELDAVIKSRGLTSFDQYAECARVGRRRALPVEQRRLVWELYTAYTRRLRASDALDYADVILRAEASLRHTPLEGYSAVVVDEAQDLSCAMIRMLALVAGDGPDALTFVGDGQQTIYPGGYTLAEAGISLAGRGVVLNTNYRNTAEIVAFAADLVAGDDFVDIEDGSARDEAPTIVRHGTQPLVQRFTSQGAHDAAIVERVRSALRSPGMSAGDIGVLAENKWQVDRMLLALRNEGVDAVNLFDYDGRTTTRVRVGTVKRAKGLEFKQVLVAYTSPALLAGAPLTTTDDEERRRLRRRELYVAMTRARDELWVGVLPT